MPVGRGAQKKLRQDKGRQQNNLHFKKAFKEAVKKLQSNPSSKLLDKTFSVLDLLKKKHIFHANKVSRLKSRLAKKFSKPKSAIAPPKPLKKSALTQVKK